MKHVLHATANVTFKSNYGVTRNVPTCQAFQSTPFVEARVMLFVEMAQKPEPLREPLTKYTTCTHLSPRMDCGSMGGATWSVNGRRRSHVFKTVVRRIAPPTLHRKLVSMRSIDVVQEDICRFLRGDELNPANPAGHLSIASFNDRMNACCFTWCLTKCLTRCLARCPTRSLTKCLTGCIKGRFAQCRSRSGAVIDVFELPNQRSQNVERMSNHWMDAQRKILYCPRLKLSGKYGHDGVRHNTALHNVKSAHCFRLRHENLK